MKLYYITSGYRRPIDILDNALIKALIASGYEIEFFLTNRRPITELIPDIKKHAPDLVITLCGPKSHLPVSIIHGIRSLGLRTAVWFVDDPYAIDNALEVAAAYDYVFTIDSGCIPYYEASGCKQVFHLPLGTDLDIFRPYAVHPSYATDVCFIGTGYKNRLETMQEMLAYIQEPIRVHLIGHFWEHVDWSQGVRPKLRSKWINFTETPRYFNGAKIVLNLHRSEDDRYLDKNRTGAPAHSINNRTFDISGCRAFQLIDYRSDLASYYEPDKEIVGFHTPKQGAELILNYLHQDGARLDIAERAYRRTINEHTFLHRIASMMSILALV
ncbi:CgeB family protein [Paenibacillus sp. 1001270B_150601_E10]|uniref:CgeB family protein n=1 Tax=Paenibacillus sp. 1001270B_150601_E10 TaxID=2787079 RepID=UPI0018A0BB28|nr:DUF3880 domain-containing protein [Paenibacillus sp. 1001270B_150601_E10]